MKIITDNLESYIIRDNNIFYKPNCHYLTDKSYIDLLTGHIYTSNSKGYKYCGGLIELVAYNNNSEILSSSNRSMIFHTNYNKVLVRIINEDINVYFIIDAINVIFKHNYLIVHTVDYDINIYKGGKLVLHVDNVTRQSINYRQFEILKDDTYYRIDTTSKPPSLVPLNIDRLEHVTKDNIAAMDITPFYVPIYNVKLCLIIFGNTIIICDDFISIKEEHINDYTSNDYQLNTIYSITASYVGIEVHIGIWAQTISGDIILINYANRTFTACLDPSTVIKYKSGILNILDRTYTIEDHTISNIVCINVPAFIYFYVSNNQFTKNARN